MRIAVAPLQPQAAAADVLFGAGVACVAIVRSVCSRPRRRSPLRRCPLCAAEAIGGFEYEIIDELQVRVRQQCGQCGVWRQVLTTLWVAGRHERVLEADRTQMRRCAERLERRRVLQSRTGRVRRASS